MAMPHLHSSMDRFEDLKLKLGCLTYKYLHSSMDRFEEINDKVFQICERRFTFQYG